MTPDARGLHRVITTSVRELLETARLEAQAGLLIRNKMFFHYDPKAIFAGYTEHFLGPTRHDERAYLSRGQSMRATRFFFADAASTGYLNSVMGSETVGTLTTDLEEIVDSINYVLMLIVGRFIQRHGYSFRTEAEV